MIDGVRVVRVSVAALASTLVALAAHLAGGGWMPGPLGVVAPVVVTGLIGLWWTRRRMSLAATVATSTLAQVASHLLFVLGAPHESTAVPTSHAMAHAPDLAAAGPNHFATFATGGGLKMWAIHAAAATMTALVVHYAEAVTRGLISASQWVLRLLLRTIVDRRSGEFLWHGRTLPMAHPWRICVPWQLVDVVRRRGPPAATST